jgi:hypothetical protein
MEPIGQIAYEAYRARMERAYDEGDAGLSPRLLGWSEWANLPAHEREAWQTAATSAVNAVVEFYA